MVNTARACGVDGCRSGWFYFELKDDSFEYGICKTFTNLLNKVPDSTNVFVDIPIGLPTADQSPRLCDIAARKILGPRRSSVFPAPIREVIELPSYEEANRISKQLTGKGLSKQSFLIIPGILDVDKVLRLDFVSGKNVREAHPELCFLSLAGGKPMQHNKKSREGFEERLTILSHYWNPSKQAITQILKEFRHTSVARDDIVDALVLAIVARHPENELAVIPSESQLDPLGLPMEMVYVSY